MNETPRGNRLHISVFGIRNAGKSSLINALTNQNLSLVSDAPGTTTDPVYKSMELLPLGPVIFIDTAGIDDQGELGLLRVDKTKEALEKTDIALFVFSSEKKPSALEIRWYKKLKEKRIPILGVINKIDIFPMNPEWYMDFKIPFVQISTQDIPSITKLKEALIQLAPKEKEKPIAGDLIKPNQVVLLVMPQDIQAPKGRLILPQVQTIRDLLDHKGIVMMVTLDQLEQSLKILSSNLSLVITDSQIFSVVDKMLPETIPLTSFSILFARLKGDIQTLIKGALSIDYLKDGDQVLIAEACTHHHLKGDIAREKLPDLLKQYTQKNLMIKNSHSKDFPQEVEQVKLIIHCGACMLNEKEMMSKIEIANKKAIPITNFGLSLAHMNGILSRVTETL